MVGYARTKRWLGFGGKAAKGLPRRGDENADPLHRYSSVVGLREGERPPPGTRLRLQLLGAARAARASAAEDHRADRNERCLLRPRGMKLATTQATSPTSTKR